MSRLRTITRRTLLVSSVAIAGGVAFGVWEAKRRLPNPLHPKPGDVTLNPWLIIDAKGVTIITPRAEMGQGIHTTLAALVAEELDVAWDQLRTLHGPAAQAYYNGVILGLALPFKEYALNGWQKEARALTDVLPKAMGMQVTGGSTSIIDAYEKMRRAGASARETLKRAAGKRLGVSVASLKTENGAVIAPDGKRLSYGELAEAAAGTDPPDVTLRDRKTWKYLGKPMPRVDMVAKCTGTAQFGIDTRLKDMAFATVRMNPRLGGKMLSFDATEAKAMPGVDTVIDLGTGIAVVASNTWLAFQAAEAVKIDWGPAPYPETTDAIVAGISKALDGPANSTLRADGKIAKAKGSLIEVEYRVPYLAHATMEPMNATALFTGDALELWVGNQAPMLIAKHAGEAVGLPASAVTLHTPYMGGGFGRRSEYDAAVLAARVARTQPGRPVQLTWSREEDMRHDYYRPAAIARFKGKVAGGTATALDARIAAPSVTRQSTLRLAGFAPPGPDKGHVEGAFDQPYGIANYRIAGHLAKVAVPVGFWRSVGNSFNGFFHESFIDELAHAAGRDPLAFRHELVAPVHAPSAKVIEAVGEMSGWTGKTQNGVGRGVAFTYSFGTPVAEVVEVHDSPDGIRISNAWIACDPGVALDPRNIEAQMISGLIFGLSAAVLGEITFADGEVEQANFPDYDALRMNTAPAVVVRILENNGGPSGIGEPGTPPSMPALANALFDLTGKRARELPLAKSFNFAL